MKADEFLRFQATVHAIVRAIAETVPTERMYSMSLGSRQGNAHRWRVRSAAGCGADLSGTGKRYCHA
jgi:hypothetical protein